jgi:hypothetical protein
MLKYSMKQKHLKNVCMYNIYVLGKYVNLPKSEDNKDNWAKSQFENDELIEPIIFYFLFFRQEHEKEIDTVTGVSNSLHPREVDVTNWTESFASRSQSYDFWI